jgi:hypothetical protein
MAEARMETAVESFMAGLGGWNAMETRRARMRGDGEVWRVENGSRRRGSQPLIYHAMGVKHARVLS